MIRRRRAVPARRNALAPSLTRQATVHHGNYPSNSTTFAHLFPAHGALAKRERHGVDFRDEVLVDAVRRLDIVLLHPRLHRGRVGPAALVDLVATKMKELVRRHGGDLAEHGVDRVQRHVVPLCIGHGRQRVIVIGAARRGATELRVGETHGRRVAGGVELGHDVDASRSRVLDDGSDVLQRVALAGGPGARP